ncbi:Uncharacterised protein [Escherichia coli]|uniref:Uncharacterized protein n=1 Tax=Escherichia coli TaxID=562 RepID=A0A376S9J2_ECOLX|nr:Uncharacterised protein [Escherichia coli]
MIEWQDLHHSELSVSQLMPYYNCVARCLLLSRIALIRISMVMI